MLIIYPSSVQIPEMLLAVEGSLMEQIPDFVDPVEYHVYRWVKEPFVNLVACGFPGTKCVWKDTLW